MDFADASVTRDRSAQYFLPAAGSAAQNCVNGMVFVSDVTIKDGQTLYADESWYKELNVEYKKRQAVARRIMDTLGCTYDNEAGGLYVWGRVPSGTAAEMSDKILYGAGVFITPGFIFGSNGANYVRISLCANVEKLESALKKIQSL